MGNAGRVLMIQKGDYNAATTYEMLDCVYYNGRSYVCKQTSTGNVPTNTTYWQVMTPDSSSEIQALTNYQNVYGSKNIWNFNPNSDIRERGYCLIAIDGNTYSFTANGNYDGISYVYPKLLTVGRKYHMQFKSKFTKAASTEGRIIVTPLDSWDVSGSYFNYPCNSSDADFVTKDYEFTATAEKLVFNVYVQFGTGSGNKFELKDLMIYDVEAILDDSYTPYAMTNKELTDNKADKSDLASISITGTTNNTGATIASGTYFYLNGALVKAKTSIASGATLTANTNYVAVTAGALNELMATSPITLTATENITVLNYSAIKIGKLVFISGYFEGTIQGTGDGTATGIIATLSEVPKSFVYGNGTLQQQADNAVFPSAFGISTSGNIYQTFSSSTIYKRGNFNFAYSV